jgi:hypothetical protein
MGGGPGIQFYPQIKLSPKGKPYDPFEKQAHKTPRNNHAQNQMTRSVASILKLSPAQSRMLHDAISHMNYSYDEIMQEAKSMFFDGKE